jgi:hypothetical protein
MLCFEYVEGSQYRTNWLKYENGNLLTDICMYESVSSTTFCFFRFLMCTLVIILVLHVSAVRHLQVLCTYFTDAAVH